MGKKQIAETPFDSSGMINTQLAKKDKGLWQGIKDGANFLNSKLIDSGRAITKIGKETKDDKLYGYYNMARSSQNIAAYMVFNNATDVNGVKTGKSLTAIFEPIHQRGKDYYKKFQEYLYHKHNVDRMSLLPSQKEVKAEAHNIVHSSPSEENKKPSYPMVSLFGFIVQKCNLLKIRFAQQINLYFFTIHYYFLPKIPYTPN